MSILFSSDYHLGTDRYSHTTVGSRKRLKRELHKAALGANSPLAEGDFKVCVGDLFDTYHNEEADLIAGHSVYHTLNLCLAGNHDMVNDSSKTGSLELLEEVTKNGKLAQADVGESAFHIKRHQGSDLYCVPHHASQEEFEVALSNALEHAELNIQMSTKILLLHCNYNMSDVMTSDTALNLTEEDAGTLLQEFDYIIMGHEHTPGEYFGGRLLIVGNTFPTSFGDVSDKRKLVFDGERMTSEKIWDAATGYKELPVEQLMATADTKFPDTLQFLKITGNVHPSAVKEVAKQIKQVWALNPNMLMIGNFTEIIRQVSDGALDFAKEDKHLTLPEKIDKALEGSPLLAMWTEIYESLKDSGEVQ